MTKFLNKDWFSLWFDEHYSVVGVCQQSDITDKRVLVYAAAVDTMTEPAQWKFLNAYNCFGAGRLVEILNWAIVDHNDSYASFEGFTKLNARDVVRDVGIDSVAEGLKNVA